MKQIRRNNQQPKLGKKAKNPDKFGKFLKRVSPDYDWDWLFLLVIRACLAKMERGEIKHLMVNIPPRHGKSSMVTIRYPAYLLQELPKVRVVVCCHTQALANKFSRQTRRITREILELNRERSAVQEWHTKAGGTYRAIGVGGAIAGEGGDYIILDDLIKNRKTVEKFENRESIFEWLTDDLYTRLEPGGHLIIINTRWHVDDPSGRLLESEYAKDWTVIDFPAIAVDYDILGRKPGDALCPARYPVEALEQIRVVLKDEAFLALYQQMPTAKGGNTFKSAWFNKRYSQELLGQLKYNFIRVIQTLDSSFKDGVGNDWSVIATWAELEDRYMLLDIWRDKVEFPELEQAATDQYEKRKPDAFLVEDKASGQSLIQVLQRKRIPAIPVDSATQQSKLSRAESITGIPKAGLVWLPESKDADWVGDWIKEHIQFPAGKHDDQVDTTAIALRYFRMMQGVGALPQEMAEDLAGYLG